jgi:hypothetical protein
MAAKAMGHSPAGLFGFSHTLGEYSGGQAEYLRVPMADVGPIKVTKQALLLLGALIFAAGTARAVDRGQFENIPDDIRAWFKGVRNPDGVPCCDTSDGHRIIYDVRAGATGTNRGRVLAGAGEGGYLKRR